jgi:hypothetical protein
MVQTPIIKLYILIILPNLIKIALWGLTIKRINISWDLGVKIGRGKK